MQENISELSDNMGQPEFSNSNWSFNCTHLTLDKNTSMCVELSIQVTE